MHFIEYIKYHLSSISTEGINWNYEDGCVMSGSILLYQVTGDKFYKDIVIKYMDSFVKEDGSIRTYQLDEYNIDSISCGKALFFLYDETKKEKYKKALDLLRSQLDTHPRTKTGNFWHKNIYPWQIWLDGLYMAQPFYAAYERRFGNKSNFTDIISQFKQVRELMFNEETALYYHGYDEQRVQGWADKETGLSPNYWLRAMGWYLMALVDTIDEMRMPRSSQERLLIKLFQEAVDGILKYQDTTSKLFYQVINHPNVPTNYLETSGSAMIAYALIKGSCLNLLNYASDVGEEILMALHNQKLMRGNDGNYTLIDICKVSGLGPGKARDGSIAYYLSEPIAKDDHKGSGAFIMAFAWLLVCKNKHGILLQELMNSDREELEV
jgi:Predicted unsaturated glucuronyl hydrolase involved in regulation of bacterial surface properties, and related proteins